VTLYAWVFANMRWLLSVVSITQAVLCRCDTLEKWRATVVEDARVENA
jgi:hypothetical protein